jgi:hypothetical protein
MREIDKKLFMDALYYGVIFGSFVALVAFILYAFVL